MIELGWVFMQPEATEPVASIGNKQHRVKQKNRRNHAVCRLFLVFRHKAPGDLL